MKQLLKRVAGSMPFVWQQRMMRAWYRRQIEKQQFELDQHEIAALRELLRPGDWVLDVGANVGHYALACSRIVGPQGRVVAFEPVPDTFALLCSNCMAIHDRNITLFNAAASDRTASRGMSIPVYATGLRRSTEAHFSGDEEAQDVWVYSMALDDLSWPSRVALVKIDTEGHEMSVLRGMTRLLGRDRPHLIVEASTEALVPFLSDFGYRLHPMSQTPNYVLTHQTAAIEVSA